MKRCFGAGIILLKHSGGQRYSYFVTPLRQSLLYLVTSESYVTFDKRVTRYCHETVTYQKVADFKEL
jgi:hypothetical protein